MSGLGWSFENERLFVSERVGGVSQSGADVFGSQSWIAIEEISLGDTLAKFSQNQSTGMRVPRITGFPIMTLGLTSIRFVACMRTTILTLTERCRSGRDPGYLGPRAFSTRCSRGVVAEGPPSVVESPLRGPGSNSTP